MLIAAKASSSRSPSRQSLSNTLGEFEPIVERLPSPSSRQHSGAASSSPLRQRAKAAGIDGAHSLGAGTTSCGSRPASAGSDSAPKPPVARSPCPKPPEGSRGAAPDLAPRLAMDYFRQLGVRTNWKPGDNCYWRGQACKVVKAEEANGGQPLRVVLRIPDGSEVTTDLCLLSEAPSGAAAAAALAACYPSGGVSQDSGAADRPGRLAPLGGDAGLGALCLDRPPALPPPTQAVGAGLGLGSLGSTSGGVSRSASVPSARGVSPGLRPGSRSSGTSGRTGLPPSCRGSSSVRCKSPTSTAPVEGR